jgi:hypothetical protein
LHKKKLVKDLLKSSLAFGTTESNLVQMAFGTIGLTKGVVIIYGEGVVNGRGRTNEVLPL